MDSEVIYHVNPQQSEGFVDVDSLPVPVRYLDFSYMLLVVLMRGVVEQICIPTYC